VLFICGGLQRTGSTLAYQIMGDLVRANGGDVPVIKQNVHYHILSWANQSNHVLAKKHVYTGAMASVLNKIKVVITVRDPRDVLCSLADLLNLETWEVLNNLTLEKIAGNRRIWMRMVPKDRRHIVKYEDFMIASENVVRGMYEFMELPFSEDDIIKSLKKWSYKNNKEREEAGRDIWGQGYHAGGHMFGGKVGKWLDRLNRGEIEWVETFARDWLDDHGYPTYKSLTDK